MSDASSVATRAFRAQEEWREVEDLIQRTLEATGVVGDDLEMTLDDYDQSIEVYAPGLTPAGAAKVRETAYALGFSLCWAHPHGGGRAKCPNHDCGGWAKDPLPLPQGT